MLNSDWEPHYYNFIQEHYAANPEIIEGLTKAINWAKGIWMGLVHRISLQQIGWEIDDEGNEIRQNPLDYQLPALSYVQHIGYIGRPYYMQIGAWFFDEQRDIIEHLSQKIEAWEQGKKAELLMPEDIRQSVQHLPAPTFLDLDLLSKRLIAMQEMAKGKKWKISDVPHDAEAYGNIKVFFEVQREQFEKLYEGEANKRELIDGMLKVCDIAIGKLKADNANPYRKSELNSYHLQEWKSFKKFIRLHLHSGRSQSESIPAPKRSGKSVNKAAEGIPKFNSEALDNIVKALKPHFKEGNHQALRTLLETGVIANRPLLFINSGNQLAYALKELFDGGLITQCNRKQLKEWIVLNFEYQEDGKDVKVFKMEYLDKIMTRDKKGGYNMHAPKSTIPILESI
jgi:hypothetical protein